jgi:hypothetical protein
LQDRAITLTLPEIPKHKRLEDRVLKARFEEARPRILGALLDAVSGALARLPHTQLAQKPRMAEFAVWACAAAPSLGWNAQRFLDAYADNRAQGDVATVESSILAGPLVALLTDKSPTWQPVPAYEEVNSPNHCR